MIRRVEVDESGTLIIGGEELWSIRMKLTREEMEALRADLWCADMEYSREHHAEVEMMDEAGA